MHKIHRTLWEIAALDGERGTLIFFNKGPERISHTTSKIKQRGVLPCVKAGGKLVKLSGEVVSIFVEFGRVVSVEDVPILASVNF